MSEFQIVALAALIGALILAGRGVTSRGISLSKGAMLAAIWVGLFAIVALFTSLIDGA